MDSHWGSTDTLLSIPHQPQSTKVSILQLFRYTSKFDKLLIFIGSIVAIATGLQNPLFAGIVGNLSQSFINFTTELAPLNATDPEREKIYDEFHDKVLHGCLLYLLLAVCSFITGTVQDLCFLIAGENLVHRLRKRFMRAVMRQDIGWFDNQKTGTLTTELFSNLERVKEGTGDHIGQAFQTFSMFIGGYAICFYNYWRLTLIGACLTPIIAIWGIWDEQKMTILSAKQQECDGEAGAVCEQALTSMRTVMAFNGQEQECRRYKSILDQISDAGIRFARWNCLFMANSIFMCFASFAITVWVGTDFVHDNKINGGVVVTMFLTIMLCIAHLDRIAPIVARVNRARGAAEALYKVIDRRPYIDSYSKTGARPEVTGNIQLLNIRFGYPTRPDVPVLKGISFSVEPGQTVALVGGSGCGKSTIVQLLLRYYDPTDGRITIDGTDIDEFNIDFLRRTIAVVSQEPVLFNTTIEENIRYGNENVTETQIWDALKKANAYDFVKEFPERLQTLVGDRGAQLSGGQKQRIAIARALVRDPKILLLDEATSALDATSEKIVQSALENASVGRTTIIIAHRLSTIQNADKIFAMRNGEIVEAGTHEELLKKNGLYFDLVNSQVFVDVEETSETHPRFHYRHSRSLSSEGAPQDYRRARSTPSGVFEAITEEEDGGDEIQKLKAEMEAEGAAESNFWRILKVARPEWRILIFTFVFSLLEGLVYPILSIGFTELVHIYSNEDKEYILRMGHRYSFVFLAIGSLFAMTQLIQLSMFGIVAERLTSRLRMSVFRNIMRMDASYFDKPQHSPGKLLTRLATDASNIKPAINERLGLVITECLTDFLSISLAFFYGWQLAIVVVPIFPLVGVIHTIRGNYLNKKMLEDEKQMESCGKLAMEAVENMRTVQSLNLQRQLYDRFCEHLKGPLRTSREKAIWQSLTFGMMSSIYFFLYALSFRTGLFLIYHDILDGQSVLRALFAISFTSGSLGTVAQYYPDYMKAKMAAGLLFKMLDQKPAIDGMTEEGAKTEIAGNIKIKNVRFNYPERENVAVLNGIDLEVDKGKVVALVGASGCGKSTTVSLLERMYDCSEGEIEIDGCNVNEMNPKYLRSNISIVSQEPILFDMSIKENILYGLEEGSISHMEMIEAAKKANIHDFVSVLPEAYNTRVGEKGTQLSGGQKQRIAIARALVRNPKILLLDEATSALDTESEKQVQIALEKAAAGRSCIVVAHRLSTIVNADTIAVFKNGQIVEKGTHVELLALNGVYWSLTQMQNRTT